MPELTIGIPVRNERHTLKPFLDSLLRAAERLAAATRHSLKIEAIVAVNGSTDGSFDLALGIQQQLRDSVLNLRCLECDEGKLNALRAVERARTLQGMLASFDADILLHPDCLMRLWQRIASKPHLEVAYARVSPLFGARQTIVERLQRIHYEHPDVTGPRRYFHGRGYILRTPALLRRPPRTRADGDAERRCRHLALESGPQVDDIYLSRVIAHEAGLDAISEVSGAVVHFVPPRSLRDFYRGQKRLLSEIRRLDALYPEHAYLQDRHFPRRVRRRCLLGLAGGKRIHYSLYLAFEYLMRRCVFLRLWLGARASLGVGRLWPPLITTKQFQERGDEVG